MSARYSSSAMLTNRVCTNNIGAILVKDRAYIICAKVKEIFQTPQILKVRRV